jgi:glycosyltransferase involved in cell wall biosynthesis
MGESRWRLNSRITLAVVRDFRAEGWPSMDLCADELLAHLPKTVAAEDVAPPFRKRLGRLPRIKGLGFNADRILNRHVLLPKAVRFAARTNDFVHIVDHSYAHLVQAVPLGRAGVYCHDLDAFRSILEPGEEPRPKWFRWLASRILNGMQSAAVVFHSTEAVRDRIVSLGLVDPAKLVHAPYGVAAEFVPVSSSNAPLPIPLDFPFLLHVGSNISRKRLDVLLDVFAQVRTHVPEIRLVQVGGPWPTHLAERIDQLGIRTSVTQLRGLTREHLAELYRRAAAVLITSEAEGFGLPVIEAMACGAAVIASDIPTLREAGGAGANYCTVADVQGWAETVTRVLNEPASAPPKEARIAHASRFTWAEHASIIGGAYLRL